jgi:hypothetical protein
VSVVPSTWTSDFPPDIGRRVVGMRTVTAMAGTLAARSLPDTSPRRLRPAGPTERLA